MKRFLLLTFLYCLQQISFAQQNVILIIADDLGTDYCGFYEDAKDTAKMPNIRSLLNKGIRFQNAWATPVCSPTRSGILTGRYPFRTGVGTAISGTSYPDLDTSEITIPQLLKNNSPVSYAAANIGKWHLNHQTPQKLNYPNNVFGYDLYSGNFLGEIPDYYNWNKITNGASSTITTYATTETVNDAINWLDTLPANKPFFLWLAFNAPHSPFHKPPDSLHTIPGLTGTQQHINQNTSLYFEAMIEAMDKETGRMFQWLINHNLMDSTNIIFIGDNGNAKRVTQITDTSHTKGTLYEYGIHVPFIISGPSVVNGGRASDALVSTPDLFTTILEIAGFSDWRNSIPIGVTIDSRSLMPIVTNESSFVRNWNFSELFNPALTADDGKAIRNADCKLIVFDDGHQEFYNLTNDLLEQNDLLLQTLTNTEISNYNYLCNELGNLIGTTPCTVLSVEDFNTQRSEISLNPNPTNGELNISVSQELIGEEISVFDVSGRIILRAAVTTENSKLETRNFSKGIYFIKIGTIVKKFVHE